MALGLYRHPCQLLRSGDCTQNASSTGTIRLGPQLLPFHISTQEVTREKWNAVAENGYQEYYQQMEWLEESFEHGGLQRRMNRSEILDCCKQAIAVKILLHPDLKNRPATIANSKMRNISRTAKAEKDRPES